MLARNSLFSRYARSSSRRCHSSCRLRSSSSAVAARMRSSSPSFTRASSAASRSFSTSRVRSCSTDTTAVASPRSSRIFPETTSAGKSAPVAGSVKCRAAVRAVSPLAPKSATKRAKRPSLARTPSPSGESGPAPSGSWKSRSASRFISSTSSRSSVTTIGAPTFSRIRFSRSRSPRERTAARRTFSTWCSSSLEARFSAVMSRSTATRSPLSGRGTKTASKRRSAPVEGSTRVTMEAAPAAGPRARKEE
ncbi:MAG TPA: hypothetical protein VFX98_00150 [Longimicrobiaceae bacterium]|nr:hypothetical protein [Longimicrobiaceae bacterium]